MKVANFPWLIKFHPYVIYTIKQLTEYRITQLYENDTENPVTGPENFTI